MQNSKYALKSQILPEVYLSTWEFSRYYLSNYDSGSVLTWVHLCPTLSKSWGNSRSWLHGTEILCKYWSSKRKDRHLNSAFVMNSAQAFFHGLLRSTLRNFNLEDMSPKYASLPRVYCCFPGYTGKHTIKCRKWDSRWRMSMTIRLGR
jgi:hypothetical protein